MQGMSDFPQGRNFNSEWRCDMTDENRSADKSFERISGFEPKFGIVGVDRATQRRTIKPSAAMLGNIARNNSL